MKPIGVDCIFRPDGTIRVRRIQHHGDWHSVEQGRQWRDGDGRHVLIMIGDRQVQEILLRAEDLQWRLKERQPPPSAVV